MSNERIDLTRYERIEGPWEPSPWDDDEVIDKSPNGRNGTIALVPAWKNREISVAIRKSIADLPDILTELKRCYEREDVAEKALLENAEMMRKYVGQITETNRKIRDTIDACYGVDSLHGEEVIGMLQELLA